MSQVTVDTHGGTGIIGFMISVGSAILSFALHALPVVQLVAAGVAITAGVLSIRSALRNKGK
jgi:hypothetical protein